MLSLARRLPLPMLAPALLAAACSTSKPAKPPPRTPGKTTVVVRKSTRAPARPTGLYGPEEALRDALSGEWEYLGTGRWPGTNRLHACAFRNQRVLVVNVYCTITEQQAFRVDVYSPQRGRLRIYAEANGPVSARARSDYFTFTAESEPPPDPSAPAPPLALNMSFAELRRYDKQRYDAFLPVCYGGEQHSRHKSVCLGPLAPHEGRWAARNRAFLDNANADWYRLVRELRALATRYGKDPE